jgi:hypothetical protein
VAFGHHDILILRHLTPFCEDFLKKESTAITQEAWRTLNVTLNRLLLALTNKLLEKLQKKENTVKVANVCVQESEGGGGIFTISCNRTFLSRSWCL